MIVDNFFIFFLTKPFKLPYLCAVIADGGGRSFGGLSQTNGQNDQGETSSNVSKGGGSHEPPPFLNHQTKSLKNI